MMNAFTSSGSVLPLVPAWGFAGPEVPWSLTPEKIQRLRLESRAPTKSVSAGQTQPVTILLIEDNRADVGLVRDTLEEHGVEGELIVLADGERGIDYIQQIEAQKLAPPDLIILDLNLPRRSGREVLQQRCENARSNQIPVVVLSSSDMRKDRDEAARLGAAAYFCKPASLDEFMKLGAAFRRLLEGDGL